MAICGARVWFRFPSDQLQISQQTRWRKKLGGRQLDLEHAPRNNRGFGTVHPVLAQRGPRWLGHGVHARAVEIAGRRCVSRCGWWWWRSWSYPSGLGFAASASAASGFQRPLQVHRGSPKRRQSWKSRRSRLRVSQRFMEEPALGRGVPKDSRPRGRLRVWGGFAFWPLNTPPAGSGVGRARAASSPHSFSWALPSRPFRLPLIRPATWTSSITQFTRSCAGAGVVPPSVAHRAVSHLSCAPQWWSPILSKGCDAPVCLAP